jgi:ethanolamine ammonia-lyase small subunit
MVDAEQLGAIVAEAAEAYFAAKNRGQGPASRLCPGVVPAFPPPAAQAEEVRDFPAHAEKQALEAANPELLQRMKNSTSARIGVGKTGPRLRTGTLLKLRSDHAAARDAVFRDVSPELLERLGMPVVQSRCVSRQEHITRPDLGRRFSDEALKTISGHSEKGRDVQVIVSDGLSSRAVEANLENLYLVLADGLKGKHINLGNPFFVRFGRVAIEDEAAELLKAKLVCILIGERPGLATAESMSAYLCYDAKIGQPESRRTVVSNIHAQGIPAAEAGAYLVDLIEKILQNKASGVDFKR